MTYKSRPQWKKLNMSHLRLIKVGIIGASCFSDLRIQTNCIHVEYELVVMWTGCECGIERGEERRGEEHLLSSPISTHLMPACFCFTQGSPSVPDLAKSHGHTLEYTKITARRTRKALTSSFITMCRINPTMSSRLIFSSSSIISSVSMVLSEYLPITEQTGHATSHLSDSTQVLRNIYTSKIHFNSCKKKRQQCLISARKKLYFQTALNNLRQ